MMKRYTRKEINQQTDRFRKTRFYTEDDFTLAAEKFAEIATACGADESKMIAMFDALWKE